MQLKDNLGGIERRRSSFEVLGRTFFQAIGFTLAVAFVGAVLYVGWAVWSHKSNPHDAAAVGQPIIPRAPHVETKTASLLPGQEYSIRNHVYRKVEVHSEYPIRVVNGDCHSNYTVQFECEGEPATLLITDLRRQPLFITPKANTILITATEF